MTIVMVASEKIWFSIGFFQTRTSTVSPMTGRQGNEDVVELQGEWVVGVHPEEVPGSEESRPRLRTTRETVFIDCSSECVVAHHLAHGAEGDDVVSREVVGSLELAVGGEWIGIDHHQRQDRHCGEGDESQRGLFVLFCAACHQEEPEDRVRLDAQGQSEGRAGRGIAATRQHPRAEADGNPHQAFDVAAHRNLEAAPSEYSGEEDGDPYEGAIRIGHAHPPPQHEAGDEERCEEDRKHDWHREWSAHLQQKEVDHDRERRIVAGIEGSDEVFRVDDARVFEVLELAGEAQQIAEALHPVAQRKVMSAVAVNRKPDPHVEVEREKDQQIDKDCRLHTSTAGFDVQRNLSPTRRWLAGGELCGL